MHLTRRRALAWLVLIFLVAAGLRLYGLFELSPPGLSHDEVANWLIVRRIFNGEHSVYFPYAYGHEAGFHYVQALFVNLLGSHALALRLPAAFSGLLGIAVTYALNRRLFGRSVALLAAALLAAAWLWITYAVRKVQGRTDALRPQGIASPHLPPFIYKAPKYVAGGFVVYVLAGIAANPGPKYLLFAAIVTVREQGGHEHTYQIVGEDEADAQAGQVSDVSPLAQALLGSRVGDTVTWKRPLGDLVLTVVSIAYR